MLLTMYPMSRQHNNNYLGTVGQVIVMQRPCGFYEEMQAGYDATITNGILQIVVCLNDTNLCSFFSSVSTCHTTSDLLEPNRSGDHSMIRSDMCSRRLRSILAVQTELHTKFAPESRLSHRLQHLNDMHKAGHAASGPRCLRGFLERKPPAC